MTNDLAVREGEQLDSKTLLSVVSNGDCAALSAEQKVSYYRARCDAAGLDPRAQPFAFIKLQGKEVLYCLKGGTDQLAAKHGVRVEVMSQVTENGIRTVTVRAITRDNRATDEIGCVTIGSASGDQLCNIYMKAVTKAKRRAILSICGLGMLDETELETIPSSSAPPSLPMPTRKSEKRPDAPKVAEAPKVAPAPTPEAINGKLEEAAADPLVVPDREMAKNDDGTTSGTFLLKDVKYAQGSNAKGAWEKWAACIDFEGAEIWPSTFSPTDGATLNELKGGDAYLVFKPNGKYWNLTKVEPPNF